MFYIQLIGILAFCILVLSYYKKTTPMILTYQIVSNLIYFLHYFLLGAISGSYLCLINVLRNILFVKATKTKKIDATFVISLYIVVTILFYENIFSLLPFIANTIYLIAILNNKKKNLLCAGTIGSAMWLVYGIFTGSYAAMITESILIVSNVIQLIKLKKHIINK